MMPSDVYSEAQFSFSRISLESLKSQIKLRLIQKNIYREYRFIKT